MPDDCPIVLDPDVVWSRPPTVHSSADRITVRLRLVRLPTRAVPVRRRRLILRGTSPQAGPVRVFRENGPDQRPEVRSQQKLAHTQPRIRHPEPCGHRVLRGHGHRHRAHGPGKRRGLPSVLARSVLNVSRSLSLVAGYLAGVFLVRGPAVRPSGRAKRKRLSNIWYRSEGSVRCIFLLSHLHHIPRNHSRIPVGCKYYSFHLNINDEFILIVLLCIACLKNEMIFFSK